MKHISQQRAQYSHFYTFLHLHEYTKNAGMEKNPTWRNVITVKTSYGQPVQEQYDCTSSTYNIINQ